MQPTEYITALITPLLDHPDALRVTETQDQMGVLVTLQVSKEDMGVVVGKGGETAKSIRHLARIVGMRSNARVSVKINEPDGSTYKSKRDSYER